jgi:hypothetical protein
MTHEPITFADIKKLLLQLGFEALVNDLGNKVFRYPNSNIMIILPAYQADETILSHHIDMIRHTLDFSDIMSPATFDGFAEKIPS